MWRRIFKAVWKDFKTQFDGILKRLGRHKELIESQAHLEQFAKYQEDMSTLKHHIEKLVAENREKKSTAVKEWLATGGQAQRDHEGFLAVREGYSRTGRWILNHEVIRDWVNPDTPATPIVWMTGIPGAGKGPQYLYVTLN